MIKIIFFLIILVYALYQIVIFFKIDVCLDKGGAWDYHNSICITDSNISLSVIKCISERGLWNSKKQICEK